MKIRTLADNEKITEPGFYNISLDRHHSQPCEGVSVTSGVLRTILLHSPAEVWGFSRLNPERYEKEDTTALRLGRAMAAYVEGGMEAVGKEYLVLPEDKPRRPSTVQIDAFKRNGFWSEAAKEGADFWSKVDADGRTPLTDEELATIRNMGKELLKDQLATEVMAGVPEITMAWQDEVTGLWCLARPDVISEDGSVSDYKKISTQGRPMTPHGCDRKIEQYGYCQQLAFGAEGMERLGIGWPSQAALVFQSGAPPHHVITRPVSEDHLRYGQILNRTAIDLFHSCLLNQYWPGPGEDVGEYKPSEYQQDLILDTLRGAGIAPTGNYDSEIK